MAHEKIAGPVEDAALRALVRKIRIESEYGPPGPNKKGIEIDDPFGPSTGVVDKTVAILKPKITFETAAGPVVVAPAGEPGPNKWYLVKGGVLVLGGFGFLGILSLFSRKGR